MGTLAYGHPCPWAMCPWAHGPMGHVLIGPWAVCPWAHGPMGPCRVSADLQMREWTCPTFCPDPRVSAYLQMREWTCPTFCPDPRVSAYLQMRESKFSFRQLSLGELSFPSFFCFAKMQTTATQTTARGRNITQTEKQNKKTKK